MKATTADEKFARTRAVIIVGNGRLIAWDDDGAPRILDERNEWIEWDNLI